MGEGASLRCAKCGEPNPAPQRFCGSCGAPLQPKPALAAHESRRPVTILFTDLSGFTELSTQLDAEDLHALVQAYFDEVERIVKRLGGSVERYIGDAVMAVFGARQAHDDDALRAVRAALEVQAGMPELGARFARPLTAVVGIAVGEVAVMEARPGYAADVAVVGASVNLAARIEALGAPGEVLISDDVHRQISGRVRAHPLGARTLKGIERPILVWRVEALIDARAGPQTPLVGREREREALAAQLEDCARERRCAAVLIRGEPGIGKTRLLGALGELAQARGFRVHGGTFLDFGLRRGADGLHAVTCSLLGLDGATSAAERREAADAVLARGELPAALAPLLYELAGCPQTEATRTLFDAMDPARRENGLRETLGALLRAAAARQGALVTLEDLHWADALDVQRLAQIADGCREHPVFLAMTSRPVEDPVAPAWRHHGLESRLARLELQALEAPAMRTLAAAFRDIERSVLDDCIARSAGNPLFLEQLLRHAAESGGSRVPASIASLVLARMDLLPVAERAALQAASVLGQRFELDALRHLLGDPGYDGRALLDAHLLRDEGRERMFAHALIHEAAYASLLHRSARALHQKAAAWYAERDSALRAQHLDRAGDAAAPRAYLSSATADTDAGRYERARAQLLRGLALAGESPDRTALTLQLGQLLHDTGEVRASIEQYRTALASSADDAQRARAWIGLAAGMRLTDDLDGALDALAQAQAAARAAGLDAELARIHYLRGALYFPRGDIDGCKREHTLALEHARRAGLPRAEADALSGLGDASYASGRMRTAYESFRACMALCARHGFGRIEAANRFMVATVRIYLNEFDEALADALGSAELARQVGHQRAEIISRLTAAWIFLTLARPEEAGEQAQIGLRVTEALGAGRFRPFLMESVARIALQQGRRGDAAATIEEALRLAREGKLLRFIGPWLLGTWALCTADAAARRAALEEGAALLEGGCVGHNYYRFYAHAISASAEDRDAGRIERWAQALHDYARPEPNPWAEFHVARGHALARWAREEPAARAALGAVREAAERSGFRDELPRLHAALAD